MRSTLKALAVLGALSVTAAACSSSSNNSTTTTAATSGNSGTSATTGNTGGGAGDVSTGVTATSVTVGQIDDISLPVPGLFKGAEDGAQAYFDYVNSTGGVNGRRLKLDARDSTFQGGAITAATADQVKNDFALVGGFSLLDSSEQPVIDLAHMPDIGFPLSPQLANDPNVFSPLPNTNDNTPNGFMKYLAHKYPQAVKHVGILWAQATASTAAAETAFENSMKSAGFDIVYNRGFSPFESTFLPDVLKMKNAGVQLFYSQQMPDNYAATLAKEMQQQSFTPIMIQGAAYSNNLVSLGGSAVNNMYIAQGYALYLGQDAGSVPAVSLFDKWVKKADPQATFEIETLYGWASAELFTQALRAAGANPTRASLVAQLGKVTSFNADGLIPTDNPSANIPAQCWLLAQIRNGKIVRATPPTPSTGFQCSPGGLLTSPSFQPEQR
ncbi:MAG TPA: ABC transporter substrate-binding protein [Acidimicrobiales bacterium]|nr:ABC transporter substrate-binding protein [Acidimicrobiales bacterium]